MHRRNFLSTLGKSVITGAVTTAGTAQAAAAVQSRSVPAGNTVPNRNGYTRVFLEEAIDRYLEALAAHDPGRAPFAPAVIFAENNEWLPLGEASWRTIDRLGRYRHYFADPEAGQAGLIANIYENGSGCVFILRLKLENSQITEAEQFVIRDPNGAALYEKLGKPDPVWLEPVPPEQRQSREALEAASFMYFQALERNDGAGIYPFREDCERIEHARPTVRQPKAQGYGHADTAVDFVSRRRYLWRLDGDVKGKTRSGKSRSDRLFRVFQPGKALNGKPEITGLTWIFTGRCGFGRPARARRCTRRCSACLRRSTSRRPVS